MGEFDLKDLQEISHSSQLMQLLVEKEIIKEEKFVRQLKYEQELHALQHDLVQFQQEVIAQKRRVLLLFEGRDAAGKGGAIKRFLYNLNAKKVKVVALSKPTETEQGQWYFQRYMSQLPNEGEIAFFDRSWYNRAMVEPVFGFCTAEEHETFMQQVLGIEEKLIDDGIELIKFFLDISKKEQIKRLADREENPLKSWKIGGLDKQATAKWDVYSQYIDKMLRKTTSITSPWVQIKTDDKKTARLQTIKYVLNMLTEKEFDLDEEVVIKHNRE